MRKLLTALLILAGLFLSQSSMAQNRDEQMINASLRFIKENANLTKKEYEKFAKLYIDYNEQLAKLNRELKPESRDYMKRWQTINDDYMKKMEKALPDSTRQKRGVAQFELGQKVWNQRSEQNRQHTEQQFRMMGQWNQMNPQFMMQPHMFDFQRFRQYEMQQDDAQQQQWWENYWRNWDRPDSAMMRRIEETRRRYRERDSVWQQRRQQFSPQYGPQYTPQYGPQYNPYGSQSGPQNMQPGGQFNPYGGPQFVPGTNR